MGSFFSGTVGSLVGCVGFLLPCCHHSRWQVHFWVFLWSQWAVEVVDQGLVSHYQLAVLALPFGVLQRVVLRLSLIYTLCIRKLVQYLV